MNLKVLWNKHICVSFLKELVALNLKLYRASYVPSQPILVITMDKIQGFISKIHNYFISSPMRLIIYMVEKF